MTNQGLSESELQAAAIEAQPLEEVTPPAPEVDKAEEVPAPPAPPPNHSEKQSKAFAPPGTQAETSPAAPPAETFCLLTTVPLSAVHEYHVERDVAEQSSSSKNLSLFPSPFFWSQGALA